MVGMCRIGYGSRIVNDGPRVHVVTKLGYFDSVPAWLRSMGQCPKICQGHFCRHTSIIACILVLSFQLASVVRVCVSRQSRWMFDRPSSLFQITDPSIRQIVQTQPVPQWPALAIVRTSYPAIYFCLRSVRSSKPPRGILYAHLMQAWLL